MGKTFTRRELLKLLQKIAKEKGTEFVCLPDRGKGSHMMVFLGDKFSTIPKGELKNGTLKNIFKDLGLS